MNKPINAQVGVAMGFIKKFTNKLTAPEAAVQLRLSNYSVSLGENLQGALDITSKEDFETTEVRCEIACIEHAKVIRDVYDAALKRSIPGCDAKRNHSHRCYDSLQVLPRLNGSNADYLP